jgi:hypothetical protein
MILTIEKEYFAMSIIFVCAVGYLAYSPGRFTPYIVPNYYILEVDTRQYLNNCVKIYINQPLQ